MSGVNSVYNNGSYVNSSGNSIQDKINNSDLSKATDDELMEVCKDFESYFVEQMMKAMVKMADVDGDGDDNIYASMFSVTENSDAGMSTMASFFGDELMSNVSEMMVNSQSGQGLGIAQTLYQQMKRNYGIPTVEGE